MVVQLQKGIKPPFAAPPPNMPIVAPAEVKDAAQAQPIAANSETYRIDLEGIQNRVYSLPVKRAIIFHLLAGKKFVAWSAVDQSRKMSMKRFYKPKAAPSGAFISFPGKDEKEAVLEEKIARAAISINGEQLLLRRRENSSGPRLKSL